MEIRLKSDVRKNEQSLRPNYNARPSALKRRKREIDTIFEQNKPGKWPPGPSLAELIAEEVAIDQELELRKRPDYEEYHTDWLEYYKKRLADWDQKQKENEYWIRKNVKDQIKKLLDPGNKLYSGYDNNALVKELFTKTIIKEALNE